MIEIRNKIIFKIILFILLSLNLYSNPLLTNQSAKQINPKELKTDVTQEIDSYDLGIIISIIQSKEFKKPSDIQIKEIESQIEKIIENINDEISYPFDKDSYKKEFRFLTSKININSKHENNIAVLRDTIKLQILNNEKEFATTIQKIIDGKNSFKDKKYFITLLNNEEIRLRKIDLKTFKNTLDKITELQDSVSVAFKEVFKELDVQIKANLLIYNYLKTNIKKYRASNFILDDLSLKYIIKQIDSTSYIKNISEILTYHFQISIGKIVILISILLTFVLLNKKVLPYFMRLLGKSLSKRMENLEFSLVNIIPSSFKLIVSAILYIFALQLSLYLLIDNLEKLNKLIPWFNTVYLALFSFMFYRILTNYINLSSDKIFSQYPNMRKEMVDFILRIIKILILIFIALFLLVQLGFDIKAIIASLGIGGIAVALAAKDTLSNFFGSLNIITDNSFSQGDWIEAGEVEGTVVDIRMRTTRIRTFANAMITVPNAQLANLGITNWSKRVIGRRIKMSIGITYDSKMSDIQNLVQDIREMLQEHPQIATNKLNIDKKPYLLKKEDLLGIKNTLLVFIDEYESSSINILVYCFSRSPVWEDWLETKQDVIVKISNLVEKNSCKFAFPTQTIHLEREKNITI